MVLPTNFTDADNQIVAGCPADSGATFIVTGRGGLPLDPRQDIEDTLVVSVLDTSLEEAELTHNEELQRSTQAVSQLPRPSEQEGVSSSFIEAQGWQVNETGQVELIATADLATTGLASQCIAKGNHDT